jgi:Zn finger protein HypA/HybF involved in hydrogenase expression
MIAIQIKLAFDCEECKHPIPLGGLVERPRCDHCQSPAKADWEKMLNFGNPSISVVQWARESEEQTEKGAFGSIHFDAARAPITCACGGALEPAALAAGQAFCPSCGKQIHVRPTPPHVATHYPEIECVVGETQIAEDGAVAQDTKPIMFACMNCGAPLRIDGSQRIVDCGSCDVPNFIPDALWLRLHPAKKRSPFWLVIRG